MSKEIETHILQYYQIIAYLGSGAYGHVWKVRNITSQKEYALKKIFDAFQNDIDAQRTYRQITILPQLQHENIIKLHQVIRAQNARDIYLVFEFMETDLHSILGQKILQQTHIRFIAYQLCKVLKYLHSAQIIHRDLKSSNILLNSSCQIKICDFGLVRSLIHEEQAQLILSEDVATRWYRSPQMLMGSQSYGKPTDIWSLGCIIAELVRGQPIFPGSSTLNQLQKIIQFTGKPSIDGLKSLGNQSAESIISQIRVKKKSLKSYIGDCDEDIKDMIIRMLQFDPALRITAQQALQLPCLQEFRGKTKQSICQKFITTDLDDNRRLTLQEYRRKIYCDIQRKYPSNTGLFMPRITKSYQSVHSRSFHHGYRKLGSNSLVKLQKNVTFYQQPSPINNESFSNLKQARPYKSYKKPLKAQVYANQKQNQDISDIGMAQNNQYINKESSKIFKRKLKSNLWAKNH